MDDVALAGRDGAEAGRILDTVRVNGLKVLGEVTENALNRLIQSGQDPLAETTIFTEPELLKIADSIASAIAAGDMLGRARVRNIAEHYDAEALTASGEGEGGGLFEDEEAQNNLSGQQTQLFSEDVWDEPDPTPFETFADPAPAIAPAQAVRYFQRLVPALDVDPERYGNHLDRRAFTIAVATEEAVLTRVKSVIQRMIEAGEYIPGQVPVDTVGQVRDILDGAGVTPRNPQYAEAVYRTNVMDSYIQGQQHEFNTPDMQEEFPAWEYHAIPDERARPHHAARDGMMFPSGVSFSDVRGTDAADVINCLPPWVTISGRITAALKSWYTGELIEVTTARGVRLTATINHPVLTPSGAVAANDLRKGQNLICYRPQIEPLSGADIQNRPMRIEDVFNSFTPSNQSPAVTSLDFDGDGVFMKGNIEMVRPAIGLSGHGETVQFEGKSDVSLIPPDAGAVGGQDLHFPFGGRHRSPLNQLGLTLTPELYSDTLKTILDETSANPKLLRQSIHRSPRMEQGCEFDGVKWGYRTACIGAGSELDVLLCQPAANGVTLDPEFLAELHQRYPGKIAVDEIVEVVRFHYNGPVYDVETEVGYFTASHDTQESIVTRNCRCSFSPVHKRILERRLAAGEVVQQQW